MKIVDIRQRTPEWHDWRAQGITASEAPVIMGRSPHKTWWRLWAERKGIVRPVDLSRNPNVRRGIANEAVAREQFEQSRSDAEPEATAEDTGSEADGLQARTHFEDSHDLILLPACGESEDHPLMRASFDGLDDDGVPVEIKCPSESTFEQVRRLKENSDAYQLYWCQVQHQILVAGSSKGYLYFWFKGQTELFEIPRDDGFIAELIEKSFDFWSALSTGKEPEKDPVRDIFIPTGADLELWTQWAADYRLNAEKAADLRARLKENDEKRSRIEGRLLQLMGNYVQGEAAGLRINKYIQQGAVDYKAALKSLAPDLDPVALEKYRKASSERVRITLKDEEKATVPFSMEAIQAEMEGDWFSNFNV